MDRRNLRYAMRSDSLLVLFHIRSNLRLAVLESIASVVRNLFTIPPLYERVAVLTGARRSSSLYARWFQIGRDPSGEYVDILM